MVLVARQWPGARVDQINLSPLPESIGYGERIVDIRAGGELANSTLIPVWLGP